MSNESNDKLVVAVKVTSEVISKPGATLEVKVVTIPSSVKEGITLALHYGKKASGRK